MLSASHQNVLLSESAISPGVIEARGYRTIEDTTELRELGFETYQCRAGLLIPGWCTDGLNGFYVLRPDNPRVVEQKKKGKLPDGTYRNKVIKYEFPKGHSMRLDCPPASYSMLGDPSEPLWITEGQKKADALASLGLCALAVLGVNNWRGKNNDGGLTSLADWHEVALNNRNVIIAFDSDVMEKYEVQQALKQFRKWLDYKNANVDIAYLPVSEDGKNGVDDYLAAGHTLEDLKALVKAPRPEIQPASPHLELLFTEPVQMRRPLIVHDGHGYAATWLPVKVTTKESKNSRGEIVRHNPPIEGTEHRLFIIRNDRKLYGEDHHTLTPFTELPFEVKLSERLHSRHSWSASSVQQFVKNDVVEPSELFLDIVGSINTFIDFDQSFANQNDMCQLLACYIMHTWVLPGLQVTGYLWPNGDRGSGKTHLLHVVSQLAYLGQLILAGGSFATLRDLADYGATLCFDDAETIAGNKDGDSDKRSLMLAGNRRGATVTLKELDGNKKWITRYVDAFCPRLFSATQLPDDILASRTIVIPLIRTLDRKRSNIDPADPEAWPVDPNKLKDQLWQFALQALPHITKYERSVGKLAKLHGRSLQPWKGMLAVAAYLEMECGVPQIMNKIDAISEKYQTERSQLESGDFTSVVVRALVKAAITAVSTVTAINSERFYSTESITTFCVQTVQDEELPISIDDINSKKVGRVLAKMRFKSSRKDLTGARGWIIPNNDILLWCERYNLEIPPELSQIVNGSNGSNGITAQKSFV